MASEPIDVLCPKCGSRGIVGCHVFLATESTEPNLTCSSPGTLCLDCHAVIFSPVPAWSKAAVEEAAVLRGERDALMAVLEPLLVEVEPALAERRAAVKTLYEELKAFQDKQPPGNNRWCYAQEHRDSMERTHSPLNEAVSRANHAFDAVQAQRTQGAEHNA